jgi:hypothetical protein
MSSVHPHFSLTGVEDFPGFGASKNRCLVTALYMESFFVLFLKRCDAGPSCVECYIDNRIPWDNLGTVFYIDTTESDRVHRRLKIPVVNSKVLVM